MRPTRLLNLVSDRLHSLPLIVLYLTDGCNSRCVTCDIWRSPRRNMSMELVAQIADQCQALDVRWVLLSGGEAMQHPHWADIAARFHQQGIHVMLLTNGLLVQRQAERLVGAVDELIVSLDAGDAETYAAIRGVDAYELVLDGMRAARRLGIPVATRTTVQHANFRQIPAIIRAAREAGASRISFLTVDVSNPYAFGPRFEAAPVSEGSALPPIIAHAGPGAPPDHGPPATCLTQDDLPALAQVLDALEVEFAADFASGLISESPAKLRQMLAYFGALNGVDDFPRPRCNAPHLSTVIEVDGRLRPCYFLPVYGRIQRDSPLLEAVNAPAALDLRRAYRTGARAECERCVCPLYKGPRSLLRM